MEVGGSCCWQGGGGLTACKKVWFRGSRKNILGKVPERIVEDDCCGCPHAGASRQGSEHCLVVGISSGDKNGGGYCSVILCK